ncbi:hypothetical protein ELS24_20875 [Achromobacter spanius]|uniref:hypothetical protein n=1 Tax=Achromobacter spanius TaxID=217203 RepID=UPI000F8FA9E3|nr:hypothetical protein [Achromobacter spanius]AZS80686.1 hypothetical protein ELS24_20875 [Achromobacter spanius]
MSERNTPFPRVAVALAYAFSEERHTANRPAMARAADDRLGEPGAFSGMDGAAETGDARKFLEHGLDRLHFAVLYAKYGQRKTQCKCCGSVGDHLEWLGALRAVANALAEYLSMSSVSAEMRVDLVRRHFDETWSPRLGDLARRHECSRSSAERASVKAADWIRGTRKKRAGENPVYGIEQAAHASAEQLLRDGGFIP